MSQNTGIKLVDNKGHETLLNETISYFGDSLTNQIITRGVTNIRPKNQYFSNLSLLSTVVNRNLERGNGIWQCEKKEFDGIIEGGGVGGSAKVCNTEFNVIQVLGFSHSPQKIET